MIRDLKEFDRSGKISNYIVTFLLKNSITKKKFYIFCEGMSRTEMKEYYGILVNAYQKYLKNNTELDLQLRYDIEDSYYITSSNLLTKNDIYSFPNIMSKYREDINPVRALYFEIAEINISFNLKDVDNDYVKNQFKNDIWFKKLMTDIEHDMTSLRGIEEKFNLLKKNYQFFTFPISYYHTQEMIKDMQKWLNTFTKFYNRVNGIKSKYD
jgi:hypothetical protein